MKLNLPIFSLILFITFGYVFFCIKYYNWFFKKGQIKIRDWIGKKMGVELYTKTSSRGMSWEIKGKTSLIIKIIVFFMDIITTLFFGIIPIIILGILALILFFI